MAQLLIINLDELAYRFKEGSFRPVDQCIKFDDLFPLFLMPPDDTVDYKVAVWEHIEKNASDDFENFYFEVFDLMLDMFHEVLFQHIRSMLGITLDDFTHEIIQIRNNTIYMKIPNAAISKFHYSRHQANFE